MSTETTCPYCDSSVYVRLDRDLLAGGEPFRFHGEWSPDEPEAWETFTLQVHGKEAADVADITVDDLVKIVRRGVESGGIEGEVRNEVYCDTCGTLTVRREYHTHGRLVTRWYLRIPVSDESEGATMSEWTQQRRDDYADGYEFARNEILSEPICADGCGADLSKEQHHSNCPIYDVEEWADEVGG